MSEEWYETVYLQQQFEKENSTWNDVKRDIEAREEMGAEKYGHYLTADTKEDMLQHAYEEALDMVVYLKTLINQRNEERWNGLTNSL